MKIRRLMLSTWIVLLAAYAIRIASADTHYVAPQGSSTPQYPYDTPDSAANSIQVAIDAAEDGDVVRVFAGTYYERVRVEAMRLDIIGDGADVTVINGYGLTHAPSDPAGLVSFNAAEGKLEGFTVKLMDNEDDNAVTLLGVGGGVYLCDSPIVVNRCEIWGNPAAIVSTRVIIGLIEFDHAIDNQRIRTIT